MKVELPEHKVHTSFIIGKFDPKFDSRVHGVSTPTQYEAINEQFNPKSNCSLWLVSI